MIGYRESTTEQDLDELSEHCVRFHDSLMREMRVIDRGFISRDHYMTPLHRCDAWLLIQFQSAPGAVELFFADVLTIEQRSAPEEIFDGRLALGTQGKSVVIMLSLDSGFELRAKRVFWRERPDWMGNQYYLVGEPPSVDAIAAKIIEPGWRECSACCDAWPERDDVQFSRCRKCLRVTEVA